MKRSEREKKQNNPNLFFACPVVDPEVLEGSNIEGCFRAFASPVESTKWQRSVFNRGDDLFFLSN